MPRKIADIGRAGSIFCASGALDPHMDGRLLTPAVVAMLTVILARGLRGFLAITSPVGGQFLVVEGWMPTYA